MCLDLYHQSWLVEEIVILDAKRDSPSRVATVGQWTLREYELMVEAPNENHHRPSQWVDKASNSYLQGWDMYSFQCPNNITGKVCGPSVK